MSLPTRKCVWGARLADCPVHERELLRERQIWILQIVCAEARPKNLQLQIFAICMEPCALSHCCIYVALFLLNYKTKKAPSRTIKWLLLLASRNSGTYTFFSLAFFSVHQTIRKYLKSRNVFLSSGSVIRASFQAFLRPSVKLTHF